MVHAAVHAGEGDVDRDRDGDRPDRDALPGARESRGQKQRDAAVDGDRCRGVAGGIARFTGRCSSRCTAGRSRWTKNVVVRYDGRLDGEREDEERPDTPLAEEGRDEGEDARDAGRTTPPAMIDPIRDASVRVPSR